MLHQRCRRAAHFRDAPRVRVSSGGDTIKVCARKSAPGWATPVRWAWASLAVELLERLLEGEIKSCFAGNVVQDKKFSAMLADVVQRYQNRSIEAAQVMEELVQMAKKFREAAGRGEQLGLTDDEVRFYDALANNESAVRELTDETLKKIAHELTENLHANLTVDWSARESVQAKLRLMVKRILRKYKYPPDQQEAAVDLVLQQARALGEAWA